MSFLAPVIPIIAGVATAASAVGGLVQAFRKPSSPSMPKYASPTAGTPTKLTAGQKTNLINTSPQGLLDSGTSARQTLLGS
jgi:hypothetical protein